MVDVPAADVTPTVDAVLDRDAPGDASVTDVPTDLDAPTDIASADVAIDLGPPTDVSLFDAADIPNTDFGLDAAPDAPAPDVLPAGCASTTVGNCCGLPCVAPNATAACLGGACAIASCAAGFADCDGDATTGCETDLRSSPVNCGACTHICPSQVNAIPTCAAGVCGVVCATGFGDCDGDAANGCETTLSHGDLANCGACNRACPAAPPGGAALCMNGVCSTSAIRCPVGSGNCDGNDGNGCETSTLDDPLNCGLGSAASAGCGVACPSAGGTASCHGGVCGLACRAGLGDCDASRSNGCETDLATDANHCGRCGHACSVANGAASCEAGSCAVGVCNPGFENCDGAVANGCEVNLRTDLANCGACGHPCAAGRICSGAVCVVSCAATQTDCSGSCRDLSTDNNNCGACGLACDQGRICARGACIRDCAAGQPLCGDTCVNPLTDNANCGGVCGRTCAGGATCQDGVCACPTGQRTCAGVCRVIASDRSNCGGCGVVCPVGWECAGGACRLTCPEPTQPCTVNSSTLCHDLNIENDNCGACGRVCDRPNAVTGCRGGFCFFFTCIAGFGNCDLDPFNGCEVDTLASSGNCGVCGNVCPDGTVCRSGLCRP